jgi:hypothetical protein
MSAVAKKPVRLELNNSGSWELLGRFDASDEDQCNMVLDAAEQLVMTLHNSEDPSPCPTLRVSMDDGIQQVLMRWDLTRRWFDPVARDAA